MFSFTFYRRQFNGQSDWLIDCCELEFYVQRMRLTCILLMTFQPSSTPRTGTYLDTTGSSSWSRISKLPRLYFIDCRLILSDLYYSVMDHWNAKESTLVKVFPIWKPMYLMNSECVGSSLYGWRQSSNIYVYQNCQNCVARAKRMYIYLYICELININQTKRQADSRKSRRQTRT